MEIKVSDALVMRSLTTWDVDEVFGVIDGNRSYLRQWLPWVDSTTSREVTANVISEWEEELSRGTDIVLGIFENGEYIGNIGLHDMKKANNSAMIGYWLAQSRQGGGIMTDCVKKLTAYGFEELKLNRIYINCAYPNAKSRAIPERLGYRQEGIFRDGECLYGQYFDLVIYGTLRRDWKND